MHGIGVKFGSINTVVCFKDRIRRERTVIAQIPSLDGEAKLLFSREAEGWRSAVYPLAQGLPRDEKSRELLFQYAKWILKGFDIKETIVFCLPAIKNSSGIEEFKETMSKLGFVFRKFFPEGFCSVVSKFVEKPEKLVDSLANRRVLSINMGSTTTEIMLIEGLRSFVSEAYTFGGNDVDQAIKRTAEESTRGGIITLETAREWKENFSMKNQKELEGTILIDGKFSRVSVKPEWIYQPLESYADRVVEKLSEFIRTHRENPSLISVLTNGEIILNGGMVNIEGFPEILAEKIQGVASCNAAWVEDGVVAPALGAKILAEYYEQKTRDEQ